MKKTLQHVARQEKVEGLITLFGRARRRARTDAPMFLGLSDIRYHGVHLGLHGFPDAGLHAYLVMSAGMALC